ncbi:MAG: CBS domain-containing protein [Desulfobacterales bacterium]|nr:CBS domain-containing protein [Desulfobacterales bacterium]
MLVKHWMKQPAVTIDEKEAMDQAVKRLKQHDIRMLPVLGKGKLVGVVTDRDLKRASASDATTLEIHELLYLISTIRVYEIMTRPVITVPENFTIEETAQVLLENKISGVPVVDAEDRVVGTITASEIFKVIISLTGVGKRGIQFAMELEDRPGAIKEVADRIRTHGGRLVSILSTYDRAPEGYRNVYIRIYGLDRGQLEAIQAEIGAVARLRYMVDHRENRREIYF